jgi:hypothetical protein
MGLERRYRKTFGKYMKRAALVRHEFSRRIRERKGESKPAFKSKWIIDLGWLVSNK